jgi:hypothetical protein
MQGIEYAAKLGSTIAVLHHGLALNPFINYPFLQPKLGDFIAQQHAKGRQVKIYDTVRELSTHCVEIYAFHSLGSEIILSGSGGQFPWACEHLIDDFGTAWYAVLPGNEGG